MVLFAPRDSKTLEYALEFGASYLDNPCAIRYPRGAFKELEYDSTKFKFATSEVLKHSESNIAFIGYGAGVSRAIDTENLVDGEHTIIDLRFIKPLDIDFLVYLANITNTWYVFSDSQAQGGVGSALLEFISEHNLNIKLKTFEYDDIYVQHGDTKLLEEELGLLPHQIAKVISDEIK